MTKPLTLSCLHYHHYVAALDMIKALDWKNQVDDIGICGILSNISGIPAGEVIKYYPELASFKPDNGNVFWFDYNKLSPEQIKEARIDILTKCIIMAKGEIQIEELKEAMKPFGKVEKCEEFDGKFHVILTEGFEGNAIKSFELMKIIDEHVGHKYPLLASINIDKWIFDYKLKQKP